MSKNIEINIKGSDGEYETLYPKVSSSNNVVSSNVLEKFGLDENDSVDDVLAEIGKYKQYWWRRRAPKTTGYIEDLTTASGWLSKSSGNISYAKSISISTDGAITFSQDGTISVSGTFPSTVLDPAISSLKAQLPCYIKTSAGGSFASSAILYLPSNASISKGDYSGDSDYGIYMSGGYTVTSKYVSGEAGSWQYIQSSDRNAYPDSGTQDGYEYEYLGVPFDNAVTAPKIEVGSYVGTGEGNTFSIQFGIIPKIVFIQGEWGRPNTTGDTVAVFAPLDSTTKLAAINYGNTSTYLNFTLNGSTLILKNTVSWSSDYKSYVGAEVGNKSGETYYYLAIG